MQKAPTIGVPREGTGKGSPPAGSGGLARYFVEHRRIAWIALLAILGWGFFSFRSLPQQEDPSFPRHDALIVTIFPGASASQVEHLVTDRIESALSEFDRAEEFRSQSRANVSVIYVMLRSHKQERIARDWAELRNRLRKLSLPQGAGLPQLDTEFQTTATLLLSVVSPRHSYEELEEAAQRLRSELKKIPSARRVRSFGGVPEQIPGVFEMERSLEELAPFTVETLHRRTGDGMVREHSVLLAVEMKEGEIIGQFNQAVQNAVAGLRLPKEMQILTVSDQPAATAQRIGQFLKCFIEALLIVVLVCLLLMDWRSAVVVALAVPLTLSLTFGGMSILGIPLQQISIAALIIALGMLVDDPVVAADGINRELASGHPRKIAAWFGPYALRRPILFGTIINIAAFLPLALLPGDMGAFIIALPLVITLALAASRIVSMTFIPLLGYHFLKGQPGFESGGEVRSGILGNIDKALRALLLPYQRSLLWALRHPVWTITISYGLLLLSFGLTQYFGKQFFPPAERHQCVIDIQLPQGASFTQMLAVCDRVGKFVRSHESVVNAVVFQGGTAPNFYYNILPRQPAPNIGQVLINTRKAADVPPLIAKLRAEIDRETNTAVCIVRQLDQGPAMEAPIMIRLTGPALDVLRQKADAIAAALANAGGYKVTDDLGTPIFLLHTNVPSDDANPVAEYAVLSHSQRQRAVTIKAYVEFGRLASDVLNRARKAIDEIKLPAGYAVSYEGEARELKNSEREMRRVMLVSISLIALAMVVQFKSAMKSLVVMLTVPLGLAGAFAGMACMKASLGFMALLGIVSLAGVIVSHIIVLSDFIEEARGSGIPLKDALVQAGLVRLRAVLVTVLATVCGLIPLAIQGGELWRPLTAVHIFGLLFATILTLLVLPVWYFLFAARLRWIK